MIYLVDYENHPKKCISDDLCYLQPTDELILFYSEYCNCVSGRMISEILESGCRLSVRKLLKTSPNALDLYIISELSAMIGRQKDGMYAIISDDRDYDPVIDYWKSRSDGPQYLIRAKSILMAIVMIGKAGNTPELVNRVQRDIKNATIEDLYKQFRKKVLMNHTDYVLQDSDYMSDKASQRYIIELFENRRTDKKSLYADILKKFGKKAGIPIYNRMKQCLNEDVMREL